MRREDCQGVGGQRGAEVGQGQWRENHSCLGKDANSLVYFFWTESCNVLRGGEQMAADYKDSAPGTT